MESNQPKLYKTPFSPSYWRQAAGELKSLKTLLLASFFIAIRVALKTVYIPVADNLNVYVGFIANALSGAVCGPVIALMSGAVCDLLGWLIAPQGAFYPLFTLIEMIGSLIYSLWLYKAPITLGRLFGAKASVNLLVNIICEPIALSLMYSKGIIVYIIPRIVKNVILLPAEVFVLALFFSAMLVPLIKLGAISKDQGKLTISKAKIIILSVAAVICVILTVLYFTPLNDAVKTFLKSLFGT